jgi:hypothetical protein
LDIEAATNCTPGKLERIGIDPFDVLYKGRFLV